MESIRLTDDGKHCDWCRPGLGRPFDATRWPEILVRLDGRVAEVLAANAARLTTEGAA